MGIELLSPCRSGVGEQDIHLICMLLHLLDQSLDFTGLRDIGGNGDGFAITGESVESCTCLLAGLRLAGRDEDLGATGLGESERRIRIVVDGIDRRVSYPDAACRPSPLEPPVTTATLPLREKREEKSLSLTSASADIFSTILWEKRECEGSSW